MDGPTIIVQDDRFRIVKLTEGDRVTYTIETPDGCDALGVERWREYKLDNKSQTMLAFRDWIIRSAAKEQQ
jgi:hypothetical protein